MEMSHSDWEQNGLSLEAREKDSPLIKKDYVFEHCFQEAESDKWGLSGPGPTVKAEIHSSLVLTETSWQKQGPTDQKCGQETALWERPPKV